MKCHCVGLVLFMSLAAANALAQSPPSSNDLGRRPHWNQLDVSQRDTLRAGKRNFRAMSPEQRQQLRQSIRSVRQLPAEEKRRLRETWRSLTPEQRREWLKAGGPGIAPPPGVD